ncbi:zf-DNL-domain-containing protein [Rhizopogon vinicolor AM-OR11-026]|uniref:Zf-DNL-domain-containing protein n=1 Tax=Rhizopogon vinicolor AM-OR11-026 TaxID=1314800 RepID=A0A1B7N205_9AGAM|nr:zf-DNL-domain-containing protein [Rhizopogon vinicolor AM-OR11-026]
MSSSSSDQKDDQIQEARLGIVFTCTAEACSHRSSHTFTKRAYERGIVIVQCPGCKNRHLIADNLGWFKDSTEEGKLRNIEDILRARGETVQRGTLDINDVVEFADGTGKE